MTRPLSIVHLGKFYPPEYGGIESVTQALAEDQARLGHRVQVICFSRLSTPAPAASGGPEVTRCQTRAVIASQPLSLRYVAAGIRALRRADIVHVHAPNLLASLIAALAPRRAKVVLHWHADIENKGALGALVRPIEKIALARANAVVCTSEPYLQSSRSIRDWRDKAHVVPIGIADGTRPADRSTAEPFILFVGRLVPYKGLSILIRAAAHLHSSARIVVVGKGPLRGALQSEAEQLGVADRIEFVGAVDDATLSNLFLRATAFCLPSINRLEAFGVVLLEAMRAGCPTIASDIRESGVSWVNRAGLSFPIGDAEALAHQMNRVLSDADLRTELSLKARKRFESEFTRSTMTAGFERLYQQLTTPR